MTRDEIQVLKVLAYGLAETSEKSDGASFGVASARRLGGLMQAMISDNQGLAKTALRYFKMREDFALLEERAATVSENCEALIKERDSLRVEKEKLQATVDLIAEADMEWLKKIGELTKERDSLKAELSEARDEYRRKVETWKGVVEERDSLSAQLHSLNLACSKVISERDELKAKLDGPLVKFALELDRMNKEAAADIGAMPEGSGRTIGAIA